MNVRKVTSDPAKARNLLENAKSFIDVIRLVEKTANAPFLINTEYDILHNIAGAILAQEGEKIIGKDHHKLLLQWIGKKYNLSPGTTHLLDELRKIRNDINYYGQKDKEVLEDYYNRNKEKIQEIRNTLLKILQD